MLPDACPRHGELALELARGELDPAGALEAEETVASCTACAAVLAGLHHPEVAAGVAQGLALARRDRRRGRWLPVAAAAAALLLAGTVVLLPRGRHPGRTATAELVERVFHHAESTAPDLNHDGRVDAADLALALARHGAPTPRG